MFLHPPSDEQPDTDPENAKDLCAVTEVEPDEGADNDSQRRNERRKQCLLLRPELVVDQRGGIDADECDECPKVQKLRPLLVAKQEGSNQCNRTYNKNVIPRHVMP